MPGQGLLKRREEGPSSAGRLHQVHVPHPHPSQGPTPPHTSLRASSCLPSVTGLEPCQGGRGLKPRARLAPAKGRALHYHLPSCLWPSSAGPATSDRWAACVPRFILSRLGRGEGGHIPEAESPSHQQAQGWEGKESRASRSPLRVRGPGPRPPWVRQQTLAEISGSRPPPGKDRMEQAGLENSAPQAASTEDE